MVDTSPADRRAAADRLIAYHAPISKALTTERTSLESKLIPVTAYILVACVEAWFRYPEMMRAIDAALPAGEVGARGRRPGTQINTVYLWSIANFWLIGRKVMTSFGAEDDPDTAHTVLDFWERAAVGFRGGDGTRQAHDAGGVVRPYAPAVVDALLDGARTVSDNDRARIKRFNATLVNYLFLMYFDTRVGTGDTGPYMVAGEDRHTLLVRDFYRLAQSDFWWSDVAASVPYRNLTAALVLDDVHARITDFGTSNTTPEDYLDRVVRFGLYTTDDQAPGDLRAVPLSELDDIVAEVRKAQAQHYRNVVAMSRDEKIRCGAYVYFSFLKPFADAAGVGEALDWTVPRDVPEPLYQLLAAMEGANAGVEEEGDYYAPLAPAH